MLNRRTVMFSIAGSLAAAPLALADTLPQKTKDLWGDEEIPAATVIRGKPNVLDFGDGLKIPLNKLAFLTLWEGKSFWMTYGFGQAKNVGQASNAAVRAADGTMQLMLLTLVFAPDRLDHADSGWRLKEQDIKNYVQGIVELPGKPFWPRTDAKLGFGNMDTASLPTSQPNVSIGPGSGFGDSNMPFLPVDIVGPNRVNAFTCYIVKKKDVDLDYVRKNAQVVKG
jgi:hypothetical protein